MARGDFVSLLHQRFEFLAQTDVVRSGYVAENFWDLLLDHVARNETGHEERGDETHGGDDLADAFLLSLEVVDLPPEIRASAEHLFLQDAPLIRGEAPVRMFRMREADRPLFSLCELKHQLLPVEINLFAATLEAQAILRDKQGPGHGVLFVAVLPYATGGKFGVFTGHFCSSGPIRLLLLQATARGARLGSVAESYLLRSWL